MIRIVRIGLVFAAIALFVESLRVIGGAQILAGIARVGWGFAAILLISGVRDAFRAFAWTRAVDAPDRLGFVSALRARMAGEALNTLLPIGVVVGEPTKASHVGKELAFTSAFKALVVEFAYYTASLVLLFAAGFSAAPTSPSLSSFLLSVRMCARNISTVKPLAGSK